MTQSNADANRTAAFNLEPAFRLLARWAQASEKWWYDIPDQPDLGCYGTGYNHWGLHTNLKYVAAMATLANADDTPAHIKRDRALQRALAAFRFTLASHKASENEPGDYPDVTLTDGNRWGQTWITALAIERMMHVMPALEPHLTDADRAAWRRVLLSEADYLLNDYGRGKHKGICAHRWAHTGMNDPESNIWNGCFLWRVAELYPDLPDADAFRERAHQFLINGVSIAADEHNETIVAGKPVRDRFVGASFFDHYALDHHGYSNVGYMVICQSNAAMLHFDFKTLGKPTPESLHHRQRELWQVVRKLVFADGRLARIGGDSRVRYAYCQEFLVPTLLYAAECFDEPYAAALLDAQIQLIQREADDNDDGSFYGKRLAHLAQASPYYYTRLESDRACALSQLIAYAPLTQPTQPQRELADPGYEASLAGTWHEPEHGDAVHRSPTRFASVAWHAHSGTQAICQPPDDGAMSDWQYNLTGRIRFVGDDDNITAGSANYRKTTAHHIQPYDAGFATLARVREGVNLTLKDGWQGSDLADHDLAFAALPDGHTLVGLQYARTCDKRAFAAEVRGLGLQLINDLYNDRQRRLTTAVGQSTLQSPPKRDAEESLNSRWANIDDRLGVVGLYGANSLTLRRFAQPQAGSLPYLRSLHVEQFNWHCQTATQSFSPDSVMLDVGWAALASVDAAATRLFADRHIDRTIQHDADGHRLRGVFLRGLDNHRYLVLANFADTAVDLAPATLKLPPGPWQELAAAKPTSTLTLPPRQARIWRAASV
ncbi:hypothetical protein ACERK3_14470 [Phycisphaerales bacterium AB-hyl4]|uniref:Uncharacterized protein n=1 Tax=Natronomicrosphaera hydrolytica TaxID=3242702 RepID=A0ABV4U7B2_9BACT